MCKSKNLSTASTNWSAGSHFSIDYLSILRPKKKRFVSGFKPQKNWVGRLAIFFFNYYFFFFFDTLVQLPKEHFPFKNLVKQTSRKSYKAISAIACNFWTVQRILMIFSPFFFSYFAFSFESWKKKFKVGAEK